MSLAPATRLGSYEVTRQIGAGGMGEVYLAHDPKLQRVIAIKILPEAAAADAECRVRFEREAQSVAALSHPNIVTIHSVEEANGVLFLTMEFVDGRPLSELIVTGGLSLAQILHIAIPLADAISAAHQRGIAHRDLKPANVMVTTDGRIKVLDFGLARLIDAAPTDPGITGAPTALTGDGWIVGTIPYMSPEQAEAKPVDGRSDIFSFGVILYEMATGQRPFDGDSQAAIIAAVLREEPRAITTARPDLPPEFVRLVVRCLKKDPARRAQSMADLRVALTEIKDDLEAGRLVAATTKPALASPPAKWSLVTTIVGAVAMMLVGVLIGWRITAGSAPRPEPPLEPVPLTAYGGDESMPTWSPDGNQIAFVWNGEAQDNRDIYVQVIGSNAPLRLTNDPQADFGPKWSPDGRYIAFLRLVESDVAAVLLVSPLGGPERRLGQFFTRHAFDQPMAELTWSQDSGQLFVSGGQVKGQQAIYRLAIDTGDVMPLATTDDPTDGYTGPALSPDGRTLALLNVNGGMISLLSLSDSGDASGLRKLQSSGGNFVRVAWTADGQALIVGLGGNTLTPLFRLRVDGGPAEPLAWSGAGASYAAISTARERLAFVRQVRDTNIWQASLDAPDSPNVRIQKLASSSFREVFPQFSPDGKRLAFHSNRGGSVQVWTADADGSRAVQVTSMEVTATTGTPRWSPDGRWIAFDSTAGGTTHVYVIGADGGRSRALTSGSSQNYIATFSRDGRWIYFSSNRSGGRQIWRAAFEGGEPQQITRQGGEAPTVSPDGEWLYYTRGDGNEGLWRMPIAGGTETRVIDNVFRYNYALGADGVYWVTRAADLTASIRFLNAKTGASTTILTITKPVDLGLALSPDGHHLLFTQVDYSGQDLMLVERFR